MTLPGSGILGRWLNFQWMTQAVYSALFALGGPMVTMHLPCLCLTASSSMMHDSFPCPRVFLPVMTPWGFFPAVRPAELVRRDNFFRFTCSCVKLARLYLQGNPFHEFLVVTPAVQPLTCPALNRPSLDDVSGSQILFPLQSNTYLLLSGILEPASALPQFNTPSSADDKTSLHSLQLWLLSYLGFQCRCRGDFQVEMYSIWKDFIVIYFRPAFSSVV